MGQRRELGNYPVYWNDSIKGIDKSKLMGSETILLVEDDNDVRDYGNTVLKKYGYQVHMASNGKIALKLVKDSSLKIDLLITDLVMPEIDGKELSNQLKKILPDAQVLITSGYTDKLFLDGKLEENLNYLAKPYSASILLKKVRDILNHIDK